MREQIKETMVSMHGISKHFPGVKALVDDHFELRAGERKEPKPTAQAKLTERRSSYV